MSAADRAAFVEAARLGGEASRKFAAQAEAEGVAFLQNQGMQVVTSIDKRKFAAAMAPIMPAFEQKYGAAAITRIREYKVAEHCASSRSTFALGVGHAEDAAASSFVDQATRRWRVCPRAPALRAAGDRLDPGHAGHHRQP